MDIRPERGRDRLGWDVSAEVAFVRAPAYGCQQRQERPGSGLEQPTSDVIRPDLATEHDLVAVRIRDCTGPVCQPEPDNILHGIVACAHRHLGRAEPPKRPIVEPGQQAGLAAEQRVDRSGRGAGVGRQGAQAQPVEAMLDEPPPSGVEKPFT